MTPQLSAKAEKELVGNQGFFLLQSRLFITRAAKNQGDAKIICKELCTDCIALHYDTVKVLTKVS